MGVFGRRIRINPPANQTKYLSSSNKVLIIFVTIILKVTRSQELKSRWEVGKTLASRRPSHQPYAIFQS